MRGKKMNWKSFSKIFFFCLYSAIESIENDNDNHGDDTVKRERERMSKTTWL